jgi:predicted membrane protein
MVENEGFNRQKERVIAGVFLVGLGIALLLKQFGVPFPSWFFSWQMLLIALGLFNGIRQGFRGVGWLILTLIGTVFLVEKIEPSYFLFRYRWPIVIILLGLFMIFRPQRTRNWHRDQVNRHWNESGSDAREVVTTTVAEYPEPQNPNFGSQDYIDSVSIFGNIRKVILSKDFKGGEMVTIFGGNELDFSKADLKGDVILDVTQIFGGTKLILPSHWGVKTDMVAFFGGIEDKRRMTPGTEDPTKLMILKGTSIFGGIEIRSY